MGSPSQPCTAGAAIGWKREKQIFTLITSRLNSRIKHGGNACAQPESVEYCLSGYVYSPADSHLTSTTSSSSVSDTAVKPERAHRHLAAYSGIVRNLLACVKVCGNVCV